MAHQVVWDKLAVTEPDATEDTIVHRGALLPDFVDDYTRFALLGTGAVKFVPDDEPDPALTQVARIPEPVRLQEHPPGLPRTDVSAADVAAVAGLVPEGSDEPDDARRSGRPRVTEDKATWYEYRVNERVANRPDDQSEEDARAQAQADLADRSKAQLVAGE